MQQSSFRIRGLLFAFGVMTFCLGAGLACPGNLDSAFLPPTAGTAGMSGGAGSGGSSGGAFPACDALGLAPTQLLKNKCGMAGCHVPNNDNCGGLDLVSDGVADRLVGHAATGEFASACGGMTYLVAGQSPAAGLLIEKLTYPPCGEKMPNLGAWSATNNQCVVEWANSITAP